MIKLSEATVNDIRQIGQDLSVSSFKILTVTGIGSDAESEVNQDRLNDAWKAVEKAIDLLALVIHSQETKPDTVTESGD